MPVGPLFYFYMIMKKVDANSYELIELKKRKLAELQRIKELDMLSRKRWKAFLRKEKNTCMKTRAKEYAKKLIDNATNAEKQLYNMLKNFGVKFKFQHPIYNKDKNGIINKFYIADFYLPDSNTIIEVDGGYHLSAHQKTLDSFRTNNIKYYHPGMKVLRIRNTEIANGIKAMKFIQGILSSEKPKKAAAV